MSPFTRISAEVTDQELVLEQILRDPKVPMAAHDWLERNRDKWLSVNLGAPMPGPLLWSLSKGFYDPSILYIFTHSAYCPDILQAARTWGHNRIACMDGGRDPAMRARLHAWLGQSGHPDPALIQLNFG